MEKLIQFIKEYNPFALFLKYIFSQNSIVQGSTVLMVARTIETQQLFNKIYPNVLQGDSRQIASWAMALGIEWGILMVTVNSRFTAKYNHIIYAISSVVMTMLFLGLLKEMPHVEFYVNVTYLSLISGYSLYSFCEILVEKTKADIVETEAQLQLTEYINKFTQADTRLSSLEKELTESDLNLTSTRGQLSEYESLIVQLSDKVKFLEKENEIQKQKASRSRNKDSIAFNNMQKAFAS